MKKKVSPNERTLRDDLDPEEAMIDWVYDEQAINQLRNALRGIFGHQVTLIIAPSGSAKAEILPRLVFVQKSMTELLMGTKLSGDERLQVQRLLGSFNNACKAVMPNASELGKHLPGTSTTEEMAGKLSRLSGEELTKNGQLVFKRRIEVQNRAVSRAYDGGAPMKPGDGMRNYGNYMPRKR